MITTCRVFTRPRRYLGRGPKLVEGWVTRLRVAVVVWCFLIARTTAAQSAVSIPIDDPMYQYVDVLIDRGILTNAIVGQRPYSLAVFNRFAIQASAVLDTSPAAGASNELLRIAHRALLRRLASAYGEQTSQRIGGWSGNVSTVRLDGLLTDAPTRNFPDNGLGTIEAELNTFTDRQFGRPLRPGTNVALESDSWLALPGEIGLQFRPRVWARRARDGTGSGLSGELLAANARIVRRGIAFSAGREYTEWAVSEGAGLLFGNNAPALDMLRVASDGTFKLPSVLGAIGPVAATLQFADIGASARNSHSRLVSYKVSAMPMEQLEIGASFENHFGGDGSRNPSFANRLIDLAPFVDIFRHHADSTDFDSDKLLGLDGRVRVRQWGQATLFGELALEDFDFHRLSSIFTEDAAYSIGVVFPQFVSPLLSARFGYRTTGLRFYEHHLVRNGIASRGLTLGEDLGRDAQGEYAALGWQQSAQLRLTAEAALELRRNNTYVGSYVNPDQTGLVFRELVAAPPERRVRLQLGEEWTGPHAVGVHAVTAMERVTAFASSSSAAQWHGMAAVSLIWHH